VAGSKEGARKGRLTILSKYGINFYREIGKKSWSSERSRKTGFALMTPEQRAELGRKGGKKTKSEYKDRWTTAEEIEELAAEVDSL